MSQNHFNVVFGNGVKVLQEFVKIAKGAEGTGFIEYPVEKGPGAPVTPKLALIQNAPEIGGLVGVGLFLDGVGEDFYRRLCIHGVILAIILASIAVASYVVGRSISNPLSDLANKMARLAKGDLDVSCAYLDERNELGDIARAFNVLRANAMDQRICTTQ